MSTLATRIGTEIKTVRTEINTTVGEVATELEMQEGTSTDVKRVTPALVKASQPTLKTINGEAIIGNGDITITSSLPAFSSF